MFFESKLNSLHHLNMDHESKHKLLAEKHDKLCCQHKKLRDEHDVMTAEHEELTGYRARAEAALAQYHIKEVAEQESRD